MFFSSFVVVVSVFEFVPYIDILPVHDNTSERKVFGITGGRLEESSELTGGSVGALIVAVIRLCVCVCFCVCFCRCSLDLVPLFVCAHNLCARLLLLLLFTLCNVVQV